MEITSQVRIKQQNLNTEIEEKYLKKWGNASEWNIELCK